MKEIQNELKEINQQHSRKDMYFNLVFACVTKLKSYFYGLKKKCFKMLCYMIMLIKYFL